MQEGAKKSGLNNLIFIAAVLGVLGLLYAISGERSNRLPENPTHMVEMSPKGCLECHGPGTILPRTEKHPPKDDCMKCHKRKRGAKTIKPADQSAPAMNQPSASESQPASPSAAPSDSR